ncbi:TonB family protein [Labilibacter sediminis]|nr:TonB family protein [Labilibacter sediminis]
MDVKKTKKADLERKRTMFLQIGFIMALGAALVAFEWETTHNDVGILVDNGVGMVDEELPPIVTLEKPEPEIVPPKKISIEQLIIVDDETEIVEELEINTESTEDLGVDLDALMEDEINDDPVPFFSLEHKPEFPGGEKALLKYLSSSVNYPVIAQENGIKGTVYLSFVISKTGKVSDVKILRGVDPAIDKEAMRVVSGMPDWKPGKQGVKAVPVSYQVPIKFMLQ